MHKSPVAMTAWPPKTDEMSTTDTLAPLRASSQAADRPEMPEPTTIASGFAAPAWESPAAGAAGWAPADRERERMIPVIAVRTVMEVAPGIEAYCGRRTHFCTRQVLISAV